MEMTIAANMKVMGLLEIGIGLFLFVFLLIFTLVISPPDAWARKWMGTKDKKKQ